MAQISVLDYIRHTPNNSNVNVVKGMLNSAGSGGNPNRIQTIQGTLAEPFGDVDTDELLEALQANEATVQVYTMLSINGSSYQFMGYIHPSSLSLIFDSCNFFESTLNAVIHTVWGTNYQGRLLNAVLKEGETSTSLMEAADEIETEIIIIWHPMSE